MTHSIAWLPTGEPPAGLTRRVDTVLDRALTEQRLVGGVVVIAYRGHSIYQRAFGWADRESARPMGLHSIFRLASVSKLIVSSAALVLAAQQRLQLDDPVQRWLPGFQPRLADGRAVSMTPRQLLSHRAGLGYRFLEPDGDGLYARAGVSDGMDGSTISLAENLRRIATVPLHYEPGSGWGYSLATDVLGGVLAAIHGGGLPSAIREWVAIPLGLTDTDFFTAAPERLATAYVNDQPQPHRLQEAEVVASTPGTAGIIYSPARILNPAAFASAGAGMAGTALDVLRLVETLRQGGRDWLPARWVEEMARDHLADGVIDDAPGCGFGLGFSILRDPAVANSPESIGTWRWGGAYGHSWLVDRERQLSVVALTNTLYEGMSGRFVTDLRDAVYRSLNAAP